MTTRALRPARVLAVLALTAPSLAVVLTGTAGPALASSGVSSPAAGTVYTSGTGTTVTADLDPCASTMTLKVVNPQHDNSWSTQSARPSSCDGLFPPSARRKPSVSPSWTSSMPNGAFAIYLYSGSSQPSQPTRSFYTNFAPLADPGNLAAVANGNTEVGLSWSYSGSEPDKAGFEIAETHAGSTRTIKVPASACSGSTCGTSISYPAPAQATTEDYSYTVTALRSSGGCDSCGEYTRSAASSSASAQLVGPPPPPSPTPTPSGGGTTGTTTGATTGGTTGGSSGGSTTGSSTGGTTGASTTGGSTGGTTGAQGGATTGSKPGSGSKGSTAKPIVVPTLPPLVASRRAFALGFNKFSPSLGIPKLPPLPATTFPVTAGENGLGDVYQPTLPYKNSEGKKTTSVLSSPIAAFSDSIGLDTDQLMKLIAIGLVLFAAAAHVRFFMSQPHEE